MLIFGEVRFIWKFTQSAQVKASNLAGAAKVLRYKLQFICQLSLLLTAARDSKQNVTMPANCRAKSTEKTQNAKVIYATLRLFSGTKTTITSNHCSALSHALAELYLLYLNT